MDNFKSNSGLSGPVVWTLDVSVYPVDTISIYFNQKFEFYKVQYISPPLFGPLFSPNDQNLEIHTP